jgi:methylmalonyl-CoA/ethylmalonyl-CoA epimerase
MGTGDVSLGELGQITLTVHDVPQAVAFYEGALGLKRLPIPAQPSLAFFDCAGVRLMLSLPEGESTGVGGAVLYFRVRGIQPSYAGLRRQGVAFLGEPHLIARLPDHDLWMAFFRDPSGNLLAIMSEEPKAQP